MRLTFKDLRQQKFDIDAEPSETIGELKAKISQEKGWDAALLKLIYSGKILQDSKTVESYNIEEKGFIVCMLSKPKASVTKAAAIQSSAATAANATATAAATSSANTNITGATTSPNGSRSLLTTGGSTQLSSGGDAASTTAVPALPSNTELAAQSFTDASTLALGQNLTTAIANMESMGFQRSDIDRAMRAAFFNPDRAVEYLLTGIPEHLQSGSQVAAAAAAVGGGRGIGLAPSEANAVENTTGGRIGAESGNEGTGESGSNETNVEATGIDSEAPINLFEVAAAAAAGRNRNAAGRAASGLEFLRNNPHFQQIRQIVQQQPQMLESILQHLGAGNPALAQTVANNPEEFLQLLAEEGESEGGMGLPSGAQTIAVTEEEREAIERLCRLGFERDLVIQAYFACDKNEELTANFLFDQPDEGDDQ